MSFPGVEGRVNASETTSDKKGMGVISAKEHERMDNRQKGIEC